MTALFVVRAIYLIRMATPLIPGIKTITYPRQKMPSKQAAPGVADHYTSANRIAGSDELKAMDANLIAFGNSV